MIFRRIVLVLSSWGGVFATAVLSYAHTAQKLVPCGANDGGCEQVAHDTWARVMGVPVAFFGLGAHLLLGITAIMALTSPAFVRSKKFMLVTGVAVASTIVSTVFTIHSKVDIHAFCNWCLASGALFTVSALVCLSVFLTDAEPTPIPKAGRLAFLGPVIALVLTLLQFVGTNAKVDDKAVASLKVKRSTPNPTAGKELTSDQSQIDLERHSEGPEQAKLTVVMFGDFDCPANHQAFHPMRTACQKAKARFVFRNYPLPIHHDSPRLAKLAEMAPTDSKFRDIAETFMRGDTDDPVETAATLYSLTPRELEDRLDDSHDKSNEVFQDDLALAQTLRFHQTPMFVFFEEGRPAKVLPYETVIDRLSRA
ncbi:MAG: vitamin K epoxide reductase family protein [bacterium]